MTDQNNHPNVEEEGEWIDVYTLTDENGNEVQYELLADTTIDGVRYLALTPYTEEEVEDFEYEILMETEDDGETVFMEIEDDEVFERVSEFFDDLFFNEVDCD